MNKTLLVACAVAGGLFVAFAAPPAQALPSVNLGIEKNADAVTPVGLRGGHHFRGGGHGFRHCRYNRLRLRHDHFGRHRFHRGHFGRQRLRYGRFHRCFNRLRFRHGHFGSHRLRHGRFHGYRPFVVGPPVAPGYYGGRCIWPCRRISW